MAQHSTHHIHSSLCHSGCCWSLDSLLYLRRNTLHPSVPRHWKQIHHRRLLNRSASSPITERPSSHFRRDSTWLAALIGAFHGICNKGLAETHFTLHMAWLACFSWPFTSPIAANLHLVAIYIESNCASMDESFTPQRWPFWLSDMKKTRWWYLFRNIWPGPAY